MRARGQTYWTWAGTQLHVRNYDERLSDHMLINIQVRQCPQAGAQLFIGVYGDKGVMLFEESYESRPGETMTQATVWGIERAKMLIGARGDSQTLPYSKPLPRQKKGRWIK